MNPVDFSDADMNDPEIRGFVDFLRPFSVEKRLSLLPGKTVYQGGNKDFTLYYLGRICPCFTHVNVPENGSYQICIIDIWDMTCTVAKDNVCGNVRIDLPGKEGISLS